MVANPFDQACRYHLNLDPVGLIGWLLQISPDAFRYRGWLNTRNIPFPGGKDRICDTVAFLIDESRGGIPWALPIEFQIDLDADMPGRLMVYMGHLWVEKRPDDLRGSRFCVGSVLVNLTGNGDGSMDHAWPEAGLYTHLGVVTCNLAQKDADAMLKEIEAGETTPTALSWVPLMQKGDDPSIIERWKRSALTIDDDRHRGNVASMALIFAEPANRLAIWQEALRGWNVKESAQVLEWQKEARTETGAKMLLQMLEAKFGSLPETLYDTIRATKEVETLTEWVPLVVRSDTLEEFQQATKLS